MAKRNFPSAARIVRPRLLRVPIEENSHKAARIRKEPISLSLSLSSPFFLCAVEEKHPSFSRSLCVMQSCNKIKSPRLGRARREGSGGGAGGAGGCSGACARWQAWMSLHRMCSNGYAGIWRDRISRQVLPRKFLLLPCIRARMTPVSSQIVTKLCCAALHGYHPVNSKWLRLLTWYDLQTS